MNDMNKYEDNTEDTNVNIRYANNHILEDPYFEEVNIEEAQLELDEILKEGGEEILIKEKLMFEPQSVNLYDIYCHFLEPREWIFLVLGIIGAIVAGGSMPLLFYIGSDIFSNSANTSESRNMNLPPHIKEMILNIIKNSVRSSMNLNIKRYLITGAISFVFSFICGFCWQYIGNKCSYNFKKRYFTLLLSQEQGWFDSYNTYELSNKVQAQIEEVEQGIGIQVGLLISGISQFIVGFIVAFIKSWKLSLIMISLTPIVLIISFILHKILRRGIIIGRKTWENAGGLAEEIIYNIKTVASFANFEYELKRFNEKVDISWRIGLINAFKLAFFNGLNIFILYISLFLNFIVGRTLVKKDYNPVEGRDLLGGDVYGAGVCIIIGFGTIAKIAPNIKRIQDSCAAASDYFNLYKRKPQMDYSQSIQRPPSSEIQGRIEFRNVNFSYPSDQENKLILSNLNLMIEPGKKVALVGESGCGKSTIVNLIERLYDVTEGQVLIDGIDVKNYDIEYLRNFIGYVQQEPVLFDTSIRQNIIFGREEYLSSIGDIDQLVSSACDDSYSSEFINNLKEKIDYVVGIKGSKLSGGQKQRIAIARAILAQPKILILDEATSALDYKSEKQVQEALDNISAKNVTSIIIAHRLSTIKNADIIYVLKDGKVLEQGNHNQLLESNGYYAELVKSQITNDEILNEIKYERKLAKRESIVSEKIENIDFEQRDNAISLSEKDIPIRPCSVIKELSDYKLDIFLACLGAIITGIIAPYLGKIIGSTSNALLSSYETIRYDDGLKYSFVLLAFAFLLGFGFFLMDWKFMSLGLTLSRIYRRKLMAKYLSFHLAYFDVSRNSPGSLLTRMSINTIELNQMLTTILGTTIQCGTGFIVGIILGCLIQPRLIFINYCFVPIILLFNILRRAFIASSSERSILSNIEAGGILTECVVNTKTVYAFNFQKKAILMYLQIIDYVKKKFIRDSIIMGLFLALSNFCYFASNAAVFAASREFIMNDSMDTEDISPTMNIVNISMQMLVINLGDLGNIKKAKIAFKSIYSTLETPSLIPPFRRDNKGKVSAMNIKGKIEFRNVHFAYPTRAENKILKGVSFIIMPGQNAAFVGESGSGKSTIIQLMNRFYDIEDGKGEILIDDVNIKNYNLYELRKKIGMVSQEPSLFKASPLENIRYGKLTASDEECLEAARQANIMKLFSKEKMDEINAEEQKKNYWKRKFSNEANKKDLMSGGEKQRLCIARTFLKNPTILLLDEATSALDKNSEFEVQNSLDKLSLNRTCINISHRLNVIENYDIIFVLEKGKIIEEGNHQELMNLKGLYYNLRRYANL